jgi:hypothetical protein
VGYRNSLSDGQPDGTTSLGDGKVPAAVVAGDWNGDGIDTFGVRRP